VPAQIFAGLYYTADQTINKNQVIFLFKCWSTLILNHNVKNDCIGITEEAANVGFQRNPSNSLSSKPTLGWLRSALTQKVCLAIVQITELWQSLVKSDLIPGV